jgi:hypothetical protein
MFLTALAIAGADLEHPTTTDIERFGWLLTKRAAPHGHILALPMTEGVPTTSSTSLPRKSADRMATDRALAADSPRARAWKARQDGPGDRGGERGDQMPTGHL